MSDFVEDVLKEATLQLSKLEGLQSALEQNPAQEKSWDDLSAFFEFIRSTAPFAGFMRSYRLADAALQEIGAYREQKETSDILPSVLKKFSRIQNIVVL